jgi:hypothetical protein
MGTEAEIWRPVPSLPDYLASNLGRVMRVPFVAAMPHGGRRCYGGEPTFGVCADGRHHIFYKGKNYRVHRMVCEAFAGAPPFPRAVVMHMDENSTNNRADNLQWGTQKENLAAPGFRAYCQRRGRASPKIDAEQAQRIKYGDQSCAQLAKEFGISPATVSNIRAGKSWKHI